MYQEHIRKGKGLDATIDIDPAVDTKNLDKLQEENRQLRKEIEEIKKSRFLQKEDDAENQIVQDQILTNYQYSRYLSCSPQSFKKLCGTRQTALRILCHFSRKSHTHSRSGPRHRTQM